VVAVSSAVAMSKVTPPGPAGAVRETVKLAVTVPALPSVTVASPMFRVGATTPPCGVTEKSSIERPWSLPASLLSRQRIQISCPGATATARLAETAVRLAAALPSSRAPPPVLTNVGLVKLRLVTAVHPVVGVSASVMVPAAATWYSKASN
jgi:hypothetical protein